MKDRIQKRITVLLMAVSLALLVNLGRQLNSVSTRTARQARRSPTSRVQSKLQKVAFKRADEFSRYDPVLRLEVLKELQARPLPKLGRNPFEFESAAGLMGNESKPQTPGPPLAPALQPPPPPFQALGYSETSGGKEAYISDEQQIYVVHEGEEFAQRYRVIQITSTQVEIEDESSRQSVQLLIPQ